MVLEHCYWSAGCRPHCVRLLWFVKLLDAKPKVRSTVCAVRVNTRCMDNLMHGQPALRVGDGVVVPAAEVPSHTASPSARAVFFTAACQYGQRQCPPAAM